MNDTNPLFSSYQYGVIASDDHTENEDVQELFNKPSHRGSIFAVMLIVSAISSAIVFQSGYLNKRDITEDEAELIAFARRDPGKGMYNGDELWPCKSDPNLQGASCKPDASIYSNIYVDPGYPTTNKPPYKMVFYKQNLYLFARIRSSSDCAWMLPFTSVIEESMICDGSRVTIADWGDPYWDFDSDYHESNRGNFSSKKMKKKKVNYLNFKFDPSSGKTSIVFQRLKKKGKKVVEKTRFKLQTRNASWNCDRSMLILTVDGNLVYATYQSPEAKAYRKVTCTVLFNSKNFMANGGMTKAPTTEPTAEPTPEVTELAGTDDDDGEYQTMEPTVAPTEFQEVVEEEISSSNTNESVNAPLEIDLGIGSQVTSISLEENGEEESLEWVDVEEDNDDDFKNRT
mmetsp:Transcript_35110/g.35746  ORF Transcript_35110/g.35746 Transcript_35110/m.35746 type:complete len:400 (+) Transcript_35110:85-1284(+)